MTYLSCFELKMCGARFEHVLMTAKVMNPITVVIIKMCRYFKIHYSLATKEIS